MPGGCGAGDSAAAVACEPALPRAYSLVGNAIKPSETCAPRLGALMLPVGILLRIVVFLFLAPINADQ